MINLNRMSSDSFKILFFLESDMNKVSLSPTWDIDCKNFANNYSLVSEHLINIHLVLSGKITEQIQILQILRAHHFLLNEFKKEFSTINERSFKGWCSNQIKNQTASQQRS